MGLINDRAWFIAHVIWKEDGSYDPVIKDQVQLGILSSSRQAESATCKSWSSLIRHQDPCSDCDDMCNHHR